MPFRKAAKKTRPDPAPEAPAEAPQLNLDRPTADEIYEQVSRNARHELDRPAIALAISGLAGGITMGLTALSVSVITASLPPSAMSSFIALLAYPIGFIAVIVGRAQLFTENTLYPVALMFAERRFSDHAAAMEHCAAEQPGWGFPIFGARGSHGSAAAGVCSGDGAAGTASRRRQRRPRVLECGDRRMDHRPGGVAGSGSHSITGSVMLIWLLTFLVEWVIFRTALPAAERFLRLCCSMR